MKAQTLHFRKLNLNAYDVRDVMKLAIAYQKDSHQFRKLPFDEQMVRNHVINALQSEDHFIFVAYHGNVPVGGFWGYVSEQIFTPLKFGYDAFAYMLPEYRGFGAARKLVEMAEAEFKSMGAVYAICGANSGINSNSPAMKMYESCGFKVLGCNLGKAL